MRLLLYTGDFTFMLSLLRYDLEAWVFNICREKPEEKAKFNTFNLTSLKYSFTMCPASIVKEEIEPRMIVEYIEYHKLLGIPHFLMYDAGGFTEVSANNLDSHLRSGTLEVVPFRGVDRFDIWEGGLVSLLSI